jgi:hypothetical protein
VTGQRDGKWCAWQGKGKCLKCQAAARIEELEARGIQEKSMLDFAYERGKAELAHLEWRIDELMSEYCPEEMTGEQLANWVAHQVPAES